IELFQNIQSQKWYTMMNLNGKIPTVMDHGRDSFIVLERLEIFNHLGKHYDPEFRFSYENEDEETERYDGILNTRLTDRDFIVGPRRGRYSIADMSFWPFVDVVGVAGLDMDKFPHVKRC
ncbi:hypothetical protein B0J11DRAFT_446147, partial [Dendryphion nanum]